MTTRRFKWQDGILVLYNRPMCKKLSRRVHDWFSGCCFFSHGKLSLFNVKQAATRATRYLFVGRIVTIGLIIFRRLVVDKELTLTEWHSSTQLHTEIHFTLKFTLKTSHVHHYRKKLIKSHTASK